MNSEQDDFSTIQMVKMDRPYRKTNGEEVTIIEDDTGYYYKLEQLTEEAAEDLVERFIASICGFKIDLEDLEIGEMENTFLKKIKHIDVTKLVKLTRAFKTVKPSSLLTKHRDMKEDEDDFIATVIKSNSYQPLLVPASFKLTDCYYCWGRTYESCKKCDMNISVMCTNCAYRLARPFEVNKGCMSKKCEIKGDEACTNGKRHRFCRKCIGKGMLYQYLEINTTQSRRVRHSFEVEQLLITEPALPVRRLDRMGRLQGERLKVICVSAENPREYYRRAADSHMNVSYKEITIELIRVKRVEFLWKDEPGVLFIHGRNNHILCDDFPYGV